MSTMDRMPNELLLQIFDTFSFNQTRSIAATCRRWRELRERCRGFWSDIQTPTLRSVATTGSQERTVASELACLRMARTNGRSFRLQLRGVYPGILAAIAAHLHHVEHLEVRLWQAQMDAFVGAARAAPAPLLHTLLLQSTDPVRAKPLPRDLFGGEACRSLTTVCLKSIKLPNDFVLPCFAGVTDLRYLPSDFYSPAPSDLFAHFPSVRTLSLRADGPMFVRGREINNYKPSAAARFQTADWSGIERLYLLAESSDLAFEQSWPVHGIPHIISESTIYTSFHFVSPGVMRSGHLVFQHGWDLGAYLWLGNDDWTLSRMCAIEPSELDASDLDEEDTVYDFDISDVGLALESASVPATMWSRCIHILGQASNITSLRLVFLMNDTFPTSGDGSTLACPNLDTLILRGESDRPAPRRIGYRDAAAFAKREIAGLTFPLRLLLENVEMSGTPDAEFARCFSSVQTQDAAAWSYLAVTAMDDWKEFAYD